MSTDLIRLPSERTDQLRQLAEHKGVSVADLIGQLVTTEINRLGLNQKIGLGKTVDFAILENGLFHADFGLGVMHWNASTLLGVANAIENAYDRKGGALDMDAGIEVTRVGTAIKIKSVETGSERTFAPSIAKELVALIRATV